MIPTPRELYISSQGIQSLRDFFTIRAKAAMPASSATAIKISSFISGHHLSITW
ncbi:hypothetical protein BMS3Bbin14_02137 [bacterium BMS3Bbin14]|nr:hypothetical protein BMS3Abin13_01872 [bacterium BMS3Abin13]GBE53637.1 hypothetical protein BMS3Bbin14_02137 [bacterium BMS3Bbin14]